ncbi:ankyrin repeat domain-containing protein [Roseobacter ponti]|uniref:Ankyrin repeat domain-containing protein n=1 Tax=Roseobacter ponti TaxID=1891787 RepID=A0A858SQG7_9RHOB|nr:ankyrin repeat domain-containing protein [Roseobacter ponti]QJF50092.1 ankyrin repeat domain-containing protein [Roseobacter ponti]
MPSEQTDPAIRAWMNAFDAFQTADIARLEELTHLSDFPLGTDGWLNHHWLSTAIESAVPESVAWVLSKNPDVHYMDDEGFTALMAALQTEADAPHRTDRSDLRDPVKAAAVTCEIIDLLLAAGVDINQRVTLGVTALHRAAAWSSPAVIRHLLDNGADPDVMDEDYVPTNALDTARAMKRTEVAALLEAAMRTQSKKLKKRT